MTKKSEKIRTSESGGRSDDGDRCRRAAALIGTTPCRIAFAAPLNQTLPMTDPGWRRTPQ